MEIRKRENKDFTRVTVVGDLTIYNAEACWQQFAEMEEVDVDKPIKINMEKVEEIDTSGIQILMQLCSPRYQRKVEIDSKNENLSNLLTLLEIKSIRVQ